MTIYDILRDSAYKTEQFNPESIDGLTAELPR